MTGVNDQAQDKFSVTKGHASENYVIVGKRDLSGIISLTRVTEESWIVC